MKYLPFLFVLPLLVSCGAKSTTANVDTNPDNLPVYCIRGVEPVGDGVHVMLDMPGLYGESQHDAPMKTTIETYESLNTPECAPNDPRMTQTND